MADFISRWSASGGKAEAAQIWWGDETGLRSDRQAGTTWGKKFMLGRPYGVQLKKFDKKTCPGSTQMREITP